jgi:hypothetical protein
MKRSISIPKNIPKTIPKNIPKSAGGWTVIAILLLLLGGAGFIAYRGLTVGNVDVPISGYFAMALGVIFSLIVGVGLMALIFYSSRKGYDEPPVVVLPEQRSEDRSAGDGQMN